MMKSLVGIIPATVADTVDAKTKLRFKDASKYKMACSLIIHEQNIVDPERLLDACQREYNLAMVTPNTRFIPREVLEEFSNYAVVVLDYNIFDNEIVLGMMPEDRKQVIITDKYKIKRKLVPIYYYVEVRSQQYGPPDFLAELPTIDKWDFIVNEALSLKAMDITISTTRTGASVYYNVRKHIVRSRRVLRKEDVADLVQILAARYNAAMADQSAKPRYFSIDIDKHNRGRVTINKSYYGMLMTIRILPNDVLNKSLEELNLDKDAIEFIRTTFLSTEKGLRLMIGETASGKNTTLLCSLLELVALDRYKIVSLEQPVEILVDGIEQIDTQSEEEFVMNADSLLRQNPDIVYFTEMTERTSNSIMKQANTAKAVFSTVHANSIADVLFRLQDLTQMPMDRIILTLHSCIYQELVRDDVTDTVKPYTVCVYFSDELKAELYGKPLAEVIGKLKGEENRWKRHK